MNTIVLKLLYKVQGYTTFEIRVTSGEFAGGSSFCVSGDTLGKFCKELKSTYENLSGKCELCDTDSNDYLRIEWLKNGHVNIRGQLGGDYNEQFLGYAFQADQTYIAEMIEDIERMLEK